MTAFFHEQRYRGDDLQARLRKTTIVICGAGALGANIAENLARAGVGRLRIIDHDRVEERNLSTQPYQRADIGAHKGKILANALYRAVGTQVDAQLKTLDDTNAGRLLKGGALVVETFDNSRSRRCVAEHCTRTEMACLHVGLGEAYGEVIWNEIYRVPSTAQDDICDYPLARNLVMLTAAVTGETIIDFIASARRRSYTVTLADLAVREFAAA